MKSEFGHSNLHMTTEEFAALVVDALDDQGFFKKGTPHHPQDIAYAFSTVGETIGAAMYWAIQQEGKMRKEGLMSSTNLRKNN